MLEQKLGQLRLKRDLRISGLQQHQDRVRVCRFSDERRSAHTGFLRGAHHGSPLARTEPDALHPHSHHRMAKHHRRSGIEPVTRDMVPARRNYDPYAVSGAQNKILYLGCGLRKLEHPSNFARKTPLFAGAVRRVCFTALSKVLYNWRSGGKSAVEAVR